MINLNEDNSCFKRAFYAGLKYAGIKDDCSWVPLSPEADQVPQLVEKYPELTCHVLIDEEYGEVSVGPHNPCLVVYETSLIGVNGFPSAHAVFVSDIGPFRDNEFTVILVITGWEKLKPAPLVLKLWRKIFN